MYRPPRGCLHVIISTCDAVQSSRTTSTALRRRCHSVIALNATFVSVLRGDLSRSWAGREHSAPFCLKNFLYPKSYGSSASSNLSSCVKEYLYFLFVPEWQVGQRQDTTFTSAASSSGPHGFQWEVSFCFNLSSRVGNVLFISLISKSVSMGCLHLDFFDVFSFSFLSLGCQSFSKIGEPSASFFTFLSPQPFFSPVARMLWVAGPSGCPHFRPAHLSSVYIFPQVLWWFPVVFSLRPSPAIEF